MGCQCIGRLQITDWIITRIDNARLKHIALRINRRDMQDYNDPCFIQIIPSNMNLHRTPITVNLLRTTK